MSGPLQIFKGPLNESLLSEDGGPAFTGVQLLTSTQAIPIPLHWGTCRISPNLIWQGRNPFFPSNPAASFVDVWSPDAVTPGNGYSPLVSPGLIQFGGVNIVPGFFLGRINIGGGTLNLHAYGAPDPSDPTSFWWGPAILALCEGPIDGIIRMWNGGGTAAMLVNWTGGVAPASSPTYSTTIGTPSLFYDLHLGTTSQTAWGYFAAANAAPGGPYYTGQDLTYRGTPGLHAPMVQP